VQKRDIVLRDRQRLADIAHPTGAHTISDKRASESWSA
jgi:hypothetical protein